MVSNQVLQKTLDGLTQITKTGLAVIDAEGGVLASTSEDAKRMTEAAKTFSHSPADSQVVFGCQFYKIYDEQHLEYILVVVGEDDSSQMLGKVAVFQIEQLMVAYRERYDRDNFIKNLLLDNLLLVDIYNRAKKLHIDTDIPRVVIMVEIGTEHDGDELDKIRSLFTGKARDFVTAVDEGNVIIVKELSTRESYDEVKQAAESIVDMMRRDCGREVRVSYGTIVGELKEVSRSYKEAGLALDVGKIFFKEHQVIAYSVLGIGRLIYQLPIPLCKMFIEEIFKDKSPDEFDEETIITINKFFENNLNVSETSRQLYIHRNTLVYRLDKLQKATGLDLRVFEDAITFKIALMVVEYMNYMEDHNF